MVVPVWGSIVHILECIQPLFGFGFDVAVADEEHGDEAQGDEQRGVGEQHESIFRISVPAMTGVTTCAAMEAV